MKQAAVITVGNELLSGYTVDTNAAYLGRRLVELGVPLVSTFTVPDEIDRIVKALHCAAEDADLILITGGLGPTDDDLTRHALAHIADVPLTLRPEFLEHIKSLFAHRKYRMSERNMIQAKIPEGMDGIDNPLGTAPGILGKLSDKVYVAMPGVPKEMTRMFEARVVPLIKAEKTDEVVVMQRLRCFGIGESVLADKLGDRMDRDRNPLINCTVDCGQLTLHVIAKATTEIEAQALLEQDVATLRQDLGDLIYGEAEQTLAEVVGGELTKRGQTLATAESCTGGLIAKMLTDNPGASIFFNYGWVTYSNDAKMAELGVPESLLIEHGAVSEPVVRAMAIGARERSNSDYSIAVTGIAGPDGGTPDKPVGLVYVGICTPETCWVKDYHFIHERAFVRLRTARTALNELRKMLVL